MTTVEKVVGRGRKKKEESSPATLPKKRGRKHRSPALPSPSSPPSLPSPPPPSPPPSPPPQSPQSPPSLSSPIPNTISFFKVMIGNFKDVLYIPPMAACTLKGLDKKNVYIEDANGKYWKVKISMVGGSLAFEKGWDDFFSAHSITVGEFVLFTYSGGLLFTARIFGTSSLERVDFQKQKRRGRCGKERYTSELKPDNVRPSKRQKASNASEDESPSNIKPLGILRMGEGAAQFDFPKSDPSCEVLKVSSSCEESLQCDSNSNESENVANSSEQNVDATVDEVKTIEELNIMSPTEHAKFGADDLDVVASKGIKNTVITTEKVAPLFHTGVAVVSKQETKLDIITKFGILNLKACSDIKAELPEMTSEGLSETTLEGLPGMTSQGLPAMTSEWLPDMTFEGLPEVTFEGLPDMISEGLPEMSSKGLSVMTSEGFREMTSKGVCDMTSEGLREMTSEWLPEMTPEELPEMTLERLPEMTSEGLPETSESRNIGINGAIEESNSHNLQMLDSEPHSDNIASLSNLKHVECSQMEFNMIEPNEISDKVVQIADGICCTLDEKLEELATTTTFNVNNLKEPICQNEHATIGLEISVPCETLSVVSSNSILICTSNKKETLMPTNGECGNPQMDGCSTIAESCLQSSTKVLECKYMSSSEFGIGHDAFIDVDEKDDTPCSSCRGRAITERRDLVDFQSSNCASFSVCLSDDVHPSLELPKEFASQMGKKLKNERKVVVLQDLSMKCWPVLYHQNNNFMGFIGGWVDFARANNIRRGDVCEFELVNKTEFKFRVRIRKQEGSVFDERLVDGLTD